MKKKLLCALATFVAVIGLFLISALAGGGASPVSDDGSTELAPAYFAPDNPADPGVTGDPLDLSPLAKKTLTVESGSLPSDFDETFQVVITPIPATSDNGFTKTYSGSSLTSTVKMTAAGTANFVFTKNEYYIDDDAKLAFTEAGTYGFTVKEVIPEGSAKIAGVTYDTATYTLTIVVEEEQGTYYNSLQVASWSLEKDGDSSQGTLTQATFTNTYTETPKVVTGMTMEVVADNQTGDLPLAIKRDGFSFPVSYDDGDILEAKYVTAGDDAWTFANNALLYKIEVKGDPGAQFTVTDNDTTLVYPTDDGVTRTETSVSGGGTTTSYTGTVGSDGSTTFYVKKTFTGSSLTLSNTATCVTSTGTVTATSDVDFEFYISLENKIQKKLNVAEGVTFEGETFQVAVTEAEFTNGMADPERTPWPSTLGKAEFTNETDRNTAQSFKFGGKITIAKTKFSGTTDNSGRKYAVYLIEEEAGTTDGMTYDNAKYAMVVWVSADGNSNKLKAEAVLYPASSISDSAELTTITFQNSLVDPVTFYPDKVSIPNKEGTTHLFYKKLTLDENSDETESLDDVFDFEVTITPTEAAKLAGYTGGPITGIAGEVAVTEDNSASDDSGKFVTFTDEDDALVGLTFTKPGSYTFTVAEVDTDEDGVTYDDTEYTLTVVVTQNETTKALEVASWTVVDADDEDATAAAQTITFRNTYLYEEDEEELPPRPTFRPTTTVTTDPTVKVKGLDTVNHVNYIVGVGDGLVNPLGTITRAEAANIFFRLMTEEWRELYWSDESSFADVDGGKWYSVAVATLEKAGVLTDTAAGGLFRPNEPITRAELAVMAAQFCTITGKIPAATFKDVDKSHWAYDEICLIEYAGWIEGDGKGNFMPDALLSRAECVTIVNRMLTRGAEPENMTEDMVTFTDNADESKWYYAAVQEAANAHEYVRTGKKLTDEDFKGERWTKTLPATDWAALELAWAQEYGKN